MNLSEEFIIHHCCSNIILKLRNSFEYKFPHSISTFIFKQSCFHYLNYFIGTKICEWLLYLKMNITLKARVNYSIFALDFISAIVIISIIAFPN